MNSSKQQKQKKANQNDFIMYQQPIDYNTPSLPSLDRLVHSKMEDNSSTPIPTQQYPKQQVYVQPKSETQPINTSLDNNSSTFYQRSDIDMYQPTSTYYPPSSLIDPDEHRIYSFMPLESVFQQKRPRRKFNEIERLYQCNYYNCTKAYGTLNHLNAHISMQEHGPKRLPIEFKELRKQLRKSKAQATAKSKNSMATSSSTEFTSPKKDNYHRESFSNNMTHHSLMTQPSPSYRPQHINHLQHVGSPQQHMDALHPSPSQHQLGPIQHQMPPQPQMPPLQHHMPPPSPLQHQMASQQLAHPRQMTHSQHIGPSQPMRPTQQMTPPQKLVHIQQLPQQQMTSTQPINQQQQPSQQQQQFQQNYLPPPPPSQPTFQQFQIMQHQQQQFH